MIFPTNHVAGTSKINITTLWSLKKVALFTDVFHCSSFTNVNQTNSQSFLQGLTSLKIRLYATPPPTTNDSNSYCTV